MELLASTIQKLKQASLINKTIVVKANSNVVHVLSENKDMIFETKLDQTFEVPLSFYDVTKLIRAYDLLSGYENEYDVAIDIAETGISLTNGIMSYVIPFSEDFLKSQKHEDFEDLMAKIEMEQIYASEKIKIEEIKSLFNALKIVNHEDTLFEINQNGICVSSKSADAPLSNVAMEYQIQTKPADEDINGSKIKVLTKNVFRILTTNTDGYRIEVFTKRNAGGEFSPHIDFFILVFNSGENLYALTSKKL